MPPVLSINDKHPERMCKREFAPRVRLEPEPLARQMPLMRGGPDLNSWMRQANEAMRRPFGTPAHTHLRAAMRRLQGMVDERIEGLARIEDVVIGPRGVPARLYVPNEADARSPALVYMHGGGFVSGGLDSHDSICRRVALEGGFRVVALDYRLAPEHPFPAAPDDVLSAWRAIRDAPQALGVDPDRMAVGGDSAGGGLAAVLTHDLRAAGEPQPRLQWLVYPLCQLHADTPSRRAFPDTAMMSRPVLDYVRRAYVPPGLEMDPRVSPLFATDFGGLAPARVVLAGLDPLHDEGRAYADKLMAAGVPVDLSAFPAEVHGFISAPRLSQAARPVMVSAARALAAAFDQVRPSR